MNRYINKLLFGNSYRQEYLCISRDDFKESFDIILTNADYSFTYLVTGKNILLGYKPLLLGIIASKDSELCRHLESTSNHALHFRSKEKSIAILELEKIKTVDASEDKLFILRGIKGQHHFLNSFHRMMNSLRGQLKKKPAGNIGLEGNLYEQVRIAYSVPRNISLVTTGGGIQCNIFPTDLHGRINEKFYVDSLRIGGKACLQVEENSKMLISEMPVEKHAEVYKLGKNHTKDYQPVSNFRTNGNSVLWGLPIPESAIAYHELEVMSHFDEGIHRVFLLAIRNSQLLATAPSLSHIHSYAASWRKKKGIATDYYLR